MDEQAVNLRERTRRAVRFELLTVAIDLFIEQGFENTTVEQIATAAGLSRRSFFRYFAGKEDVLVQAHAGAGQDIAAALIARPDTETPWPALRRAFDPLIDAITSDERALAMMQLVIDSPRLRSSHNDGEPSWHRSIGDALAQRLPSFFGTDHRRLRAAAIAGAAVACLTTAQVEWASNNGAESLAGLLDVAMSAVAPITG